MKNIVFAVIASLALSSCIGDAAMKVHGIAPSEHDCEVQLVSSSSGQVVDSEKVSGEFNETFVWGVLEGKMDLVGVCDGIVTKKYVDWKIRKNFSEAFEIGDISP